MESDPKRYVKMAHGAGGRSMQDMLSRHLLKYLEGAVPPDGMKHVEVPLSALDDSSVVDGIVFTTDSHTVKPLFFPGGDIGSLSVAGTVNDLSVMGAAPRALSLGMIIENGFPFEDLERIAQSIAGTSRTAGVPVVTGDTKVMEKGAIDRMVINTSGIGIRSPWLDDNIAKVGEYRSFSSRWMLDSNLADGDVLIVSGTVGDHGISLLSFREGYGFEADLESDVCPLNGLIEEALRVGGIVSMKDPTRGGLSNTLNELSEKSAVGIIFEEEAVPISPAVVCACDMLGLDPLEIGNEGKVVIAVVEEMAEDVLRVLKKRPEGRDAAIIGRADDTIKNVVMETLIGGRRIVEPPVGDPIPRIC